MAEANGAVITKARPAAVPSEIGGTGLRQYGGSIAEEYLSTLQGRRGIRTYTEMRDAPIIGGMLLAIENFVRRVDWTFDPADNAENLPGGEDEAQRWADWMGTVIGDMETSWDDAVSEIFSMIPYGWSLHEPTYKRRLGPQPEGPQGLPYSDFDDGLIGWQGLPIRAQDSLTRWEIDANGRTLGMHQQLIGGARYIPMERALLFRTTSAKGSPEGRSSLRSAYRAWYFLRRLEEFEAIGIERDLAGLPVAYVPSEYLSSDATDPQKAMVRNLLTLVTKIRRNEQEGLVFPRDYDAVSGKPLFDLQLLASGGTRAMSVTDAINRKNSEIAISVLADWLLLGHQEVGSRALADPKVDVFMGALETWTSAVADVINSHGIPRLMRANGVDPRLSPRLRPSKVTQVDATDFVAAVGRLADSALLNWGPDDEDHARVIVGLPPRDDTIVTPIAPTKENTPAPAAEDEIPTARQPRGASVLQGMGA